MESRKPTRKVGSASIGGAVVVILAYAAGQLGLELTPEVTSALTVLIMAGIGYMVPDSK